MSSFGEILSAALRDLGWPGLLVAIFFIFMLDAMVIPTLPELFTIAFYVQYSLLGVEPLPWAVALLIVAVLGEISGNGMIYLVFSRLLVRKRRLPKVIEKAVKTWADFLVVKGEKVILVNRFAPAVPFMGVFIAVCGWNVRTSFIYIVAGSLAKYSLLLALVGYLNVAYDPGLAQWLTVAAVVVIVALSVMASVVRKKRVKSQAAAAKRN